MSFDVLVISYQACRNNNDSRFCTAGIKNTFNDVPLAAEFKGAIPERQVRQDTKESNGIAA